MAKTFIPRRARTSSVYRGIEQLMGALLAIAERTPKKAQGLQVLSRRMVNEALEALAATEYALNEPDMERRIAYICALIHSMTILRSATRQMYGYSRQSKVGYQSSEGQTSVRVPCNGRVISDRQYLYLADLFERLSMEIGRWLKSSQAKQTARMGKAEM